MQPRHYLLFGNSEQLLFYLTHLIYNMLYMFADICFAGCKQRDNLSPVGIIPGSKKGRFVYTIGVPGTAELQLQCD